MFEFLVCEDVIAKVFIHLNKCFFQSRLDVAWKIGLLIKNPGKSSHSRAGPFFAFFTVTICKKKEGHVTVWTESQNDGCPILIGLVHFSSVTGGGSSCSRPA